MDELIIPRVDDFAALADAEAQMVRTTVLDKLAADSARYLSEYSERFENVLNADDAATLFGEYNADRARYRVAVHPAATWVRDEFVSTGPGGGACRRYPAGGFHRRGQCRWQEFGSRIFSGAPLGACHPGLDIQQSDARAMPCRRGACGRVADYHSSH
jgi:hypothetical protein